MSTQEENQPLEDKTDVQEDKDTTTVPETNKGESSEVDALPTESQEDVNKDDVAKYEKPETETSGETAKETSASNTVSESGEKEENKEENKENHEATLTESEPTPLEKNTTEQDGAEGTKKKQAPESSLPARPLKRARTAYFIFTDEKRPEVQSQHQGEGVAAVARVMGQMWAALPPEEKEGYQQQAAQERERVAKELEAWKAAGGVLEADNGNTSTNRDPTALTFPVARIRKICKLDPEVRGLSKEALLLVTKCAELATRKLGQESARVAQLQNRRKLLPDDVAHVCAHREQFLFLKDDVKDLVKTMAESSSQTKGAAKKDASRETAAAGSKPLTSYFGATSR